MKNRNQTEQLFALNGSQKIRFPIKEPQIPSLIKINTLNRQKVCAVCSDWLNPKCYRRLIVFTLYHWVTVQIDTGTRYCGSYSGSLMITVFVDKQGMCETKASMEEGHKDPPPISIMSCRDLRRMWSSWLSQFIYKYTAWLFTQWLT